MADADKKSLRKDLLALRPHLAQKFPDAGRQIVARILADIPVGTGDIVAGYMPVRGEVDIRPALEALHQRGIRCVLPAVREKRTALQFRLWSPSAPMEPGVYGIPMPVEGSPPAVPTVLLAPMVGFDRQGWRLGYGAGEYDRTLAALRQAGPVRAVGIAMADQEVADGIPHEGHDQKMDWIVTERYTLCLRGET
ncbi:MAG: 5-formyltetrahydrofolate cyclo-ligase [Pseudomonadota bacterium]|nr:5-formyltetrahydrofolate cyclo-ligase [Pseudomonadota bacterium]